MHIYLDDKTVILYTDAGAARWTLETTELAHELFDLLILSDAIENRIDILCNYSN